MVQGPLPVGFGNLTNLVRLDLGSNRLSGIELVDWARLGRLEHVDISRNKVEAPTPITFIFTILSHVYPPPLLFLF